MHVDIIKYRKIVTFFWMLLILVTGNGEQGTGNREQGTGNREQGTGNREQGTGNMEREFGDVFTAVTSK